MFQTDEYLYVDDTINCKGYLVMSKMEVGKDSLGSSTILAFTLRVEEE
jgi:hypothetical protein